MSLCFDFSAGREGTTGKESMAARRKRKRLVAAIDWFRNSTKGVSYEDMKVEFL